MRVCRSGDNPFKALTKTELTALQKVDSEVTEFKSNPWGPRAADYAKFAKTLPEERWDSIYEGAAEVAGEVGNDRSDGDDGDGEDSRSALLL